MDIRDLAPLAIVIVIIAIMAGMGAVVLNNMQGQVYTANTAVNETFNATSDPYEHTTSHASDSDFYQLTDLTCYTNVSQAVKLTGTNCNISDASAGKIKISEAVDGDTESIDYNFETSNTATGTISDGVSALADFSSWFGIVVLVVIAAIIIGIVTKSFGSRAKGV